jgi:VWFA-related protein
VRNEPTPAPDRTRRSPRHVFNVLCALCVGTYVTAVATSNDAARSAQQLFRSGVDGVTIQVSVTQRNHPVGGLLTSDFGLLDNGVPQTLSTFQAQQIPLDLTLLLDLSTSVDGKQLQRLKTAVRETAALLHADDRIRLVAISQVLREVFSLRPGTASIPLDSFAAEGGTSLYDGIAGALMRRADAGRRQLIVALTDGRDSASILAESDVKDIARLSDAVIDIVVPIGTADAGRRRLAQRDTVDSLSMGSNVSNEAGRSSAATDDDRVVAGLRTLVDPTGGRVIALAEGESVSRSFAAILQAFRAGYVLQYIPHGVAPGGWHEVTVSVKKPGHYDVQARRGYRGRSTTSEPIPEMVP